MIQLLGLQHSSVFEAFGGVEYYMDDFLQMAADLYPDGQIETVIPKRGAHRLLSRPYRVTEAPLSSNKLLRRLANRYSPSVFRTAAARIKADRPKMLMTFHVSMAPLTCALSAWSGIPYATVVHGIEAWGNLWPQDEWALRKSDLIISVSHWTKKILVERGFSADKIVVVHNSLNPAFEAVPARERAAASPFTLLTVSRMDAREQYKGQDHVLEALARLRRRSPAGSFKYLIQGEGTDLPRLKRLCGTLGLQAFVEFHPSMKSRDDLEALYRRADAFIMPSRFGRWDGHWRGEGFGLVYIEAAAFGLPSVAYDWGGVTDIVRNNETGILVPGDDIESLSAAIGSLVESPERAAAMGANARKRVLSTFSRSAVRPQIAAAMAACACA